MEIDWITDTPLAAGPVPVGPNDLRFLHQQGIRAIVSLTEQPIMIYKGITPAILKELDIVYLHAPIPDGYAPDVALAQEILRFIAQVAADYRPTYMHCHAGIGRTGTMLHCYYLALGLSIDEAAARVRSRRPACNLLILSNAQRTFLEQFAAVCQS